MAERKAKKDDSAAVLEKIESWPEPYRSAGARIHELVLETVPQLKPRLWYGAAGYALDGPVLFFFRVDEVMSIGITEKADLSVADGAKDRLVEAAWYLTGALDEATEKRIARIVRAAVG